MEILCSYDSGLALTMPVPGFLVQDMSDYHHVYDVLPFELWLSSLCSLQTITKSLGHL